MPLLERVIEHEGFESKPYQDHLGNWTFGHGLTWISVAESTAIVSERLQKNMLALVQDHPWLDNLTEDRVEVVFVVTEMSYQMGVAGVNKFKNMWAALENEDYQRASVEMLDSQWARQTPTRAIELADIIREVV